MKRHWIAGLIGANLVVLIALVFVYPHLMVSPGALMSAHRELSTDCFACHAPLRGVASDRCIACHTVADIGLRTTKGVVLPSRSIKTSFHQSLSEKDCVACHSDHADPILTKRSSKPFSHELLRVDLRERCQGCHTAPTDGLHRDLTANCSQCHSATRWKPATFKHSLLAKSVLDRCEGCHKAPTDKLHSQFKGNCMSCHTTKAWKPATFDHDKYFVLDRDHNASCATCHTTAAYKVYTCYGCHEHTVENIRRKHEKEGIREFANCVKCHKSARDKPEGKGERGRRERD